MKSLTNPLALMLALSGSPLAVLLDAAEPPGVGAPAVELPPMLVEESVSHTPWLHVSVAGMEFLSRCSASTTRQFVEAWRSRMQLMRVLIPQEFLPRIDVPAVFVLYSQDLRQTVSAEIQRELQAGEGGSGRVNVAPNMRLTDRDMHASIAYLDESQVDASTLTISSNHVRYLLQGRLPDLPAWLVEGLEGLWRDTDFVVEPVTLPPLTWLSTSERDALAANPARPRALLPATELFASESERAGESRHRRRVTTRLAQQTLFVRWALVSGGATREAFWRFAAQAAEGPATEERFEACFGFDYAELRDRLSDYLPKAAQETFRLPPGRLPPLPPFEVELATPDQIARIRGEWERLAIGYVQRRFPQVREPYIAQARRTLRRAFDAGDRDPRLLATLGLCEIDAGNPAGAAQFLEPAVAGGVVRPRAYYELAQLRFAELRAGVTAGKRFSFTELAPVIEPLRRSLTQAPPLPEAYVLLAEAWAACDLAPNTAEFAELEQGARLFGRRPTVVLPIARALAQHGRKSAAANALDATAGSVTDEPTRAAIAGLMAELHGGQR